jgi:hypothetical protein
MNRIVRNRRLLAAAGLACVVELAGCASAPVKPAPVVAPPPPPPAPEAIVTMAPIPNPEPRHHAVPAEPRTHKAVTAAKPAPAAKAPSQAAEAPAVDPARAAKLRERGLEALNRGAAAKAVALLSQASRLDPENALIKRDLERAEKINRAVGGR